MTTTGTDQTIAFPEGGYRYARGVFQYSAGVAALPGFAIERVRFQQPIPLEEGFDVIAAHLGAIGRPLAALCACELRSPAPFSERGFLDFNRVYAGTLERWGLVRGERNPVARTNVCPRIGAPATPAFQAFSYTVPADDDAAPPSFVVSGGGEAPDGHASYREVMVRLGDTSPEGLRAKLGYVMTEMERRLAVLGFGWRDAAAVQAYTVHDIGALVFDEIVQRGGLTTGLTWHMARPPIVDMEVEMDLRCARRELALSWP
ncbi:hypothetical protein SAMN05518845_103519 [Variovorax sp. YR750]|uniref:2-amino-5-chloromuconate deaminase CnbZ n=1 Tax=Variovorax sp. YR750 TaxID=1884384 RepID=UPI0008AB4BE6|nr:hypothetical protein [Variovorax sp. YR750]SEK92925.1 hypothetical protein SAMN05518845_103519 [Variovorax sp. YR750]